jgi:predicted RNA-binding Zn-ribbon protein involved in translation (DUF1610 family)
MGELTKTPSQALEDLIGGNDTVEEAAEDRAIVEACIAKSAKYDSITTPKDVLPESLKDHTFRCPNCGNVLERRFAFADNCPFCGQSVKGWKYVLLATESEQETYAEMFKNGLPKISPFEK